MKINIMSQKRLTDEQKIELVELFKNGNKSRELSDYFNITDGSVRSLLKNRGYSYKRTDCNKKHEIYENYFDVIDTQDKAYFLGFLYADGCNKTNRNTICLSLKEGDREILEKLNRLIFPDKNLFYEANNRQGSSNTYGIRIQNKHMSERLVELGVVRAKTFLITFPEWLDNNLYNHFIRGYIDGDGYIGIMLNKKNGYLKHKVTIVGTESFCNYLSNIFLTELCINTSIETRHPERNHNIRSLNVSGRIQVIKLLDYIYKDSNLKLERKYNKYVEILNTVPNKKGEVKTKLKQINI